jgi:hypothetical protein
MFAIVAASNWGLGTVPATPRGSRTRSPSVSKKKNSLSLLIGPPTEPAH